MELRDHEWRVLEALVAAVAVDGRRVWFSPVDSVWARCPGLARRVVRKDLVHLEAKGLVRWDRLGWGVTPSGRAAVGAGIVVVEHVEQVLSSRRATDGGAAVDEQDRATDPPRRRAAGTPGQGPVPPLDAA